VSRFLLHFRKLFPPKTFNFSSLVLDLVIFGNLLYLFEYFKRGLEAILRGRWFALCHAAVSDLFNSSLSSKEAIVVTRFRIMRIFLLVDSPNLSRSPRRLRLDSGLLRFSHFELGCAIDI
jgi:hypothetical protein